MKRFTLRLLLFCLLPLPVLYGLNYIIEKGLKKSRSYYYAEWNDIFNSKANADVLICGSSRAYVHVSPKIIDSMLHVNSYNIGMNGTQFLMQYDRFKIYLKHNKKPKYLIQTLDFASFSEKYELYAYQQFLPYLADTDIAAMTRNYNGKFGFMELYFPMFRYNNQMAIVAEGMKSYLNRGAKSKKYKGYEGQNRPWDAAFANDKPGSPAMHPFNQVIDKKSVAAFFNFLERCREEDIKVILVFPPVYKEYLPVFKNKAEILSIYDSAAHKYRLPLLYFFDDPLCADKELFYNSQHLNRRGSELFTQKMVERILPLMTVDQH